MPAALSLGLLLAVKLPADATAMVARESEVRFSSGGAELAGTLALPPVGSGPFPALVMVPGGLFEAFDRDAKYENVAFFRQIAQRLAAHGVASLRYDRRGVGKSAGEVNGATVRTFGEDGRAAAAFLRSQAGIHPHRVGYLAHGIGVVMLLEAASDDRRAAATVLIAGSTNKGGDAILENWANIVAGWPNATDQQRAEAIAELRRIIEAARSGKGLGALSPKVHSMVDTAYFRSLIAFDPKPLVRKLRSPALIVHGQKDRQVSADHARKMQAMLRASGNRSVTTILDPYLNHILMPCKTGYINEYPALGTKADPETIEELAEWAGQTLATAPGRSGRPVATSHP